MLSQISGEHNAMINPPLLTLKKGSTVQDMASLKKFLYSSNIHGPKDDLIHSICVFGYVNQEPSKSCNYSDFAPYSLIIAAVIIYQRRLLYLKKIFEQLFVVWLLSVPMKFNLRISS